MNRAPLLVGCILPLLVASVARAQTFSYPDFTSIAGLTLNGAAVQSTNQLRLTNNGSNQTGSAWRTTPVAVAEGFDTTIDFVVTSQAEGLAFVIQGSPAGASALGGDLWGLGYGFGSTSTAITNSLAIEIDNQQNGFLNDTSGNELSVHTTGIFGNSENESVSISRITPTFDMSNGQVHRLRVAYMPGTLTVYVDNLTVPLLTKAFTFENGATQITGGNTGGLGLSGITAHVGFTSSTAFGVTNQHARVQAWSWQSFFQPPPCYVGNILAGSTGPHDVLNISGSNGGFFRLVSRAVADPFSIGVVPPPGQPSAPFVMFFTLGVATAATVTTTPWGDACFPPNVIDIGGFIAPYTLNVPPGIPLNLSLTFQGVMGTDPLNPAQLELTNAVALQFTLGPAPQITSSTPNSAPLGGTITINGTNFSPFVAVDINNVGVPLLTNTANQITFAMPANVPCAATLRVRNPDGAQATVPFNPVPTITNTINPTGPAAGGTSFIIIGTGMAPGTTVTIGGVPAIVSSSSATVLVTTTPPSTPGPKPVVVTTPGGCTVNTTFTYL